MAYLFDTDAISEAFKRKPAPAYLRWLSAVPREEQLTSAVVIGELYEGAFLSDDQERHLENLESRVLPAVTVLPYDASVARTFGELQAALAASGTKLADADAIIAATALAHDLALVTGNIRHFARVPGLRLQRALADARTK
jgi:tRNA(fMet)-specific endonuclease VapC